MKTRMSVLMWLPLAAAACVCCALRLPAQTAPTITTQPLSQTNLAGTNVTFTVAVSGTGPFTYQWQFNGTNLPNTDIINTVAGGGAGGDGGAATNASLNYPHGLTLDASGSLYIADTSDNRIRKVYTNGIITTVAGNGNQGYSGDGVPASNTALYAPLGVALDDAGDLYIADSAKNRIRKVDTNGIITTVAGNGTNGYSGDGGAATNASLNSPYEVLLDASRNLYVADAGNNRIRKVDTSGAITTIAGNGSANYGGDGGAAINASLDNPVGMAFDLLGNLYIADQGNNRIRKVGTNGIITTVAGKDDSGYNFFSGDGGPATNAQLHDPAGVAVAAAGDLYIADYSNVRIRKVDTNGIITTVAGNGLPLYAGDGGSATMAELSHPTVVELDSAGNLYVSDMTVGRIREVHYAGYPTRALTNLISQNAGNYTVVITSPYGSVTSTVATLTVVTSPPSIIVQPVSQMVLPGSEISLGVGATGSTPLWYSWYFDATNLALSGTNAALVLSNTSVFNAGGYTVVITNAYGSVTSQVASLVVQAPPGISVEPASQGALAGANPMLLVVVAGTGPFGYFWYFDSTNLIQSGTSSTLTLPDFSTTNAGNYIVVVTNAFGSVTSQVASVSLAFPPSVAAQPASQTNMAGTSVTFAVAVSGTGPFTYQWQFNSTNLPIKMITTMAGNGSQAYSGDGGAATKASLNYPYSAAFDAAGNLYIADTGNRRIRKVDTNGIITTVAGNGTNGYSGDGGAATNACLGAPYGVALDGAGNLYIADQADNSVRKVDTNGIITTVAGNGTAGYSGDGGAATNATLYYPQGVVLDGVGNLYIADRYNQVVRKVDTNGIITTVAGGGSGGDGGAATTARLPYPMGMAFDANGNLYIAQSSVTYLIRKVDTNGIITTVAGGGSGGDGGAATNASLGLPCGVALDSTGNLYIADTDDNRIRKVDNNGIITTLAGNGSQGGSGDGGAATNATLNNPYGVTTDAAGNVFIADTHDNRIREVLMGGSLELESVNLTNAGNYAVIITSPYGSVTSAVAALTVLVPPAILVQPPSQFALAGSNVTFSVTATGTAPLYYSWYDNATNMLQTGTNSSYTVSSMTATNAGSYTVVVTNAYGSVTSQVATLTVVFLPTVTTQPVSEAVLPGATAIFSVAATGAGPGNYQWQSNGVNLPNNIISTVAGTGTAGYTGDGGTATGAELDIPFGVGLDAAGNIYVADLLNSRIRKVVVTSGIITTVAGTNSSGYSGDGGTAVNACLNAPHGVATDASGNLYIADSLNNRIRKVDANGIITTVAGTNSSGFSGDGSPAVNAKLYSPSGVALDAFGNIYIADYNNNRIRMVGTNGIITTVAGTNSSGFSGDGGPATNAKLNAPTGVAVDSTGQLFIADYSNNRIRKVDTNGVITTVAGNGSRGFSGDGGAAINASLNYPSGVACDAFGNLFVADSLHFRVRKVDSNGVITTVAGNGIEGYSGDGGAPTSASLNQAQGVALDAAGNLYIADTSNNRIRKALLYAGYPTLTLNNVSVFSVGSYTVVISNSYGTVTSAVATLTVEAPPVFTLQPASQMVVVGSSPVLSVAVAGSGPFGYLCYLAGTNLVQSGTNGTLTLPAFSATNAGNYTVVVTNAWGSVTSQVATLTAAYPPSVTTPPGGQTVLGGGNVNISVAVSGTGPFHYQWQFNGTNLPNNTIRTVAGNGSLGFSGDGGPATSASLNAPLAEAFDAFGNLYIADCQNDRIRIVGTNGLISTYAGTTNGFFGDGGAATNAKLYQPKGLALDASGDLYISDTGNSRIRKVGANGIITTVAGNGTNSYSGNGGPATNAGMSAPYGVALDSSGNLYIADSGNGLVRMVGTNGIITTVAGGYYQPGFGDGGPAVLSYLYAPVGVALDVIGNLYIADQQMNRTRKVDTHGIITTFTQAASAPDGVAADVFGNLYIAATGNRTVLKVDTNGIITAVAGATNGPVGVCVDASGNLCFGDGNVVREVYLAGFPTLAITNVSATNAGSYSVVVSSPYGCVTSAVATLIVQAPPVITLQPANQTVLAGSSPTFSVAVAGSGTFEYLWYLAGTNRIQSGKSSSLTLPSVFTNDSGHYTVVVLNTWGSVTSAVASLTVTIPSTPPQIVTLDGCFGFLDHQFGFNLSGSYGQTIVVDGSADLVNWTPLATNMCVGDGGSAFYFCDPCWTNSAWRFYRARLP